MMTTHVTVKEFILILFATTLLAFGIVVSINNSVDFKKACEDAGGIVIKTSSKSGGSECIDKSSVIRIEQ